MSWTKDLAVTRFFSDYVNAITHTKKKKKEEKKRKAKKDAKFSDFWDIKGFLFFWTRTLYQPMAVYLPTYANSEDQKEPPTFRYF